MTIELRAIVIALAVLVSAPATAQTQNPSGPRARDKDQQTERARERCKLNRGVDCDTPEGLKEWLLQERPRAEAVREGSRHLPPAPPQQSPARR